MDYDSFGSYNDRLYIACLAWTVYGAGLISTFKPNWTKSKKTSALLFVVAAFFWYISLFIINDRKHAAPNEHKE